MTESKKSATYSRGLGRRKEAVAQVRLVHGGSGVVTVNGKSLEQYFPLDITRQRILAPLNTTGTLKTFDVIASVKGGGSTGQADGIRLGIARALVLFNPEFRPALKPLGYLKRDARIRERKKYGKKSARRSPQWAKR